MNIFQLSDNQQTNPATIEVGDAGMSEVAIELHWNDTPEKFVQAIFSRDDAIRVAHAILGVAAMVRP